MIVWCDTETSGLDPKTGHLLEVALVTTDDQLNEVAAKSVLVEPVGISIDEMVAKLDPRVLEMHTKNGLLDELRAGKGVRRFEAEVTLGAVGGIYDDHPLLSVLWDALKRVPMAGSTIGFDRAWLKEHMPKLESLFSYRSIDVSSFTEMAKRWAPQVYESRPKKDPEQIAHRALADVRESIDILRYYRGRFIGGAL